MIITLSGRFGSGSRQVAELLAEKLGYTFYSDDMMLEALKDYGLDVESEMFKYYDENDGEGSASELKKNSRIQRVYGKRLLNILSMDVVPMDERIRDTHMEAINKLADGGNCVFLGRCADYYLKDREDLLRIRIYNTDENRQKMIAKKYEISDKEALDLIHKATKRRIEYYEYFTGNEWGDPNNFDLLINISALGAEEAVSLLAGYCSSK